jgi:hypothetical protein
MSAAIRRKVSELTHSQALQRRELVKAWRAAKTAFAPAALDRFSAQLGLEPSQA